MICLSYWQVLAVYLVIGWILAESLNAIPGSSNKAAFFMTLFGWLFIIPLAVLFKRKGKI